MNTGINALLILFLAHVTLGANIAAALVLRHGSDEALTTLAVVGATALGLWLWAVINAARALGKDRGRISRAAIYAISIVVFEINVLMALTWFAPVTSQWFRAFHLALWPLGIESRWPIQLWLPVLVPAMTLGLVLHLLSKRFKRGGWSVQWTVRYAFPAAASVLTLMILAFWFCFVPEGARWPRKYIMRWTPDFIRDRSLHLFASSNSRLALSYARGIIQNRAASENALLPMLDHPDPDTRDRALLSLQGNTPRRMTAAMQILDGTAPFNWSSCYAAAHVLANHASAEELRAALDPARKVNRAAREALISKLREPVLRSEFLPEFRALALQGSFQSLYAYSLKAASKDVEEVWRAVLADPVAQSSGLAAMNSIVYEQNFEASKLDVANELIPIIAANGRDSGPALWVLSATASPDVLLPQLYSALDSQSADLRSTALWVLQELKDDRARARALAYCLRSEDASLCQQAFSYVDIPTKWRQSGSSARAAMIDAALELLNSDDVISRRFAVHFLANVLKHPVRKTTHPYVLDVRVSQDELNELLVFRKIAGDYLEAQTRNAAR